MKGQPKILLPRFYATLMRPGCGSSTLLCALGQLNLFVGENRDLSSGTVKFVGKKEGFLIHWLIGFCSRISRRGRWCAAPSIKHLSEARNL